MDTREAVARAMAYFDAACDKQRFSDENWEKYTEDADIAIAAHLKALADAGYVVVPREPTSPIDNPPRSSDR